MSEFTSGHPAERTEDALAEDLRALSTWPDALPNVWRKALARAPEQGRGARVPLRRLAHARVPYWALGAAALIAIGFVVQSVVMDGRDRSHREAVTATSPPPPASPFVGNFSVEGFEDGRHDVVGDQVARRAVPGAAPRADGAGAGASGVGPRGGDIARNVAAMGGQPEGQQDSSENVFDRVYSSPGPSAREPNEDVLPDADRHVVRKATIELEASDVRAAYLKAMLVANAARGEFVEQSSLTGSGDTERADATLRVTADRLDAVLSELRQLGEVVAEKSVGDDVTSQVVDLEARLRNERHVEQELLELLDQRQDADLADILRLRQQINLVRGQIERMTAQRMRLRRLVSLATVLVIIRQSDAPGESSLGAYFRENLADAWTGGLEALAVTLGFLVRIAVGGVVWWVLLVLVVIAMRQHQRRRIAAGA